MATVTIQLTPEAQAILARFKNLPATMLEKMRAAMDQANELAIGRMTASRFTGRGPFPVSERRLGVRTGRLRASIRRNAATISGNTIQSAIGSNVVYAGVHEFGSTASGTTTVRTFTRRQRSRDQYASPARTGARGVRQPGTGARLSASGVATVRSHVRRWKQNIPARAPFRTGIEDNLPIYQQLLSQAVIDAAAGS